MGIRENFKRGSIEMLILYLLTQEDMYGYQLAQEINQRSEGQFDITEGSMYPTLYRLIEKNAISDYKKLSGKRRTRVYYHIEKEGVELLEKLKADYHAINAGVEKILGGKSDAPAVKPKTSRGRKKKSEGAS
ncbi:MAG: PadR family transcriptional regulator [Eubacterium sp.]|nr:PadR family transcriptional regulator [Eubacterium sp.]